MLSLLKKMVSSLLALGVLVPLGGCTTVNRFMHKDPTIAPAWTAWECGDLELARSLSEKLLAKPETSDAGHHILSLVAHVQGDHFSAIAHRVQISPKYRWLSHLDEAIIWSHVHSGDIEGALGFAQQRSLERPTIARLKLAADHPLTVELDGVAQLAFTADKLSPFMPGIGGTFCGRRTVVRLDTGGSFVHLSPIQAEQYGIDTVTCEKGFASLTTGKICFGVADELTLGPAVLRNVPVAVHHGALATKGIAEAFGVEIGPIIGTNILQHFLSTIDAPNGRLILSQRGNKQARKGHLSRIGHLSGKIHELPFLLWLDHYMIAHGSVASLPARFFVDSGLVAINDTQGQVALLASHGVLSTWGASDVNVPLFSEVPGKFCIGTACRNDVTAYPVADNVWKSFGDWGGIKVDALVSWGFLSHFTWTVDFDRHIFLLGTDLIEEKA
jgi:hypothetical protein